MGLRCAILDDYQGVALSFADWSGLDVTVFQDHVVDEDVLVARLRGVAVLVVMRERTPLTASLLDRLPDLRLVVTSGMRNASIDLAAAARNGVVVSGTGGGSHSTAELTWALIHAVTRHVVDEATALRGGGPWQRSVGADLFGRRLGLVGLGRIGTQVARVGLAFGMDVVAWSPHLTAERTDAAGVTLAASLTDLLRTSDVVSVHLVLADSTRGLIGARELGLMPPTSLLINTSRAAIVDQAAMIDALRTGALAGAGLDVFEQEPLAADDPLRTLPTVVATPHLGYVTGDNDTGYFTEAVEDIAAFEAGSPIRLLT